MAVGRPLIEIICTLIPACGRSKQRNEGWLAARLKSRRRRKESLIQALFQGIFETPYVVSYRNELFLNGLLATRAANGESLDDSVRIVNASGPSPAPG